MQSTNIKLHGLTWSKYSIRKPIFELSLQKEIKMNLSNIKKNNQTTKQHIQFWMKTDSQRFDF